MCCAVLTSWPSSSAWVCDSRISVSHSHWVLSPPVGSTPRYSMLFFQSISLTSSTMSHTRLSSSEHVYNLVSLQLTILNYWMVYMRKNFAFVFVAFSIWMRLLNTLLHCFVIHYTYVNLNGWGCSLVGPKPWLLAGLGSQLRLEISQA